MDVSARAIMRKIVSVLAAFALVATLVPASGLAFAQPSSDALSSEAAEQASSATDGQDRTAGTHDATEGTDDAADDAATSDEGGPDAEGMMDTSSTTDPASSDAATDATEQARPVPVVDVVAAGVPLGDEASTLLTYDGLVYHGVSENSVEAIGWSGEAPVGTITVPERIMVGSMSYAVVGVRSVTDGIYGQADRAPGIERICLPASLKSIDPAFFAQFPSVFALDVATGNDRFAAYEGIVCSADTTTLVAAPPGIEVAMVASACTTISQRAFAYAPQLRTIVADDAVSQIASDAFHASAYAEATVIANERAVWEYAGFTHFGQTTELGDTIEPNEGQSGLAYKVLADHTLAAYWAGSDAAPAQLSIPATAKVDGIPYVVSAIAAEGFRGQAVLEALTLPSSIKVVGSAAFADCTRLRQVVAFGEVTEVASDALEGCQGTSVYVPRTDGSASWQLGAPAAGNHLMPYGVKASPEVLYLQVGATADVFAGGFCEAPGNVQVGYSYLGQVDVHDGVVTAKQLGTTPITVTLSLDGMTLAEASTTAVVSLLPAMQVVQGGASVGSEDDAVEPSALGGASQDSATDPNVLAEGGAASSANMQVAALEADVCGILARSIARVTGTTPELFYTVSFDGNGGTTIGGPLFNVQVGESRTIFSYATRPGYAFRGWSYDPTASTPVFAQGGTFRMTSEGLSHLDEGNLTLYAVWEMITYRVVFSENGGSGSVPASASVSLADPSFMITANQPLRDGFTFKGWAYESETDTSVWRAYDTFVLNEQTLRYADNETITLYAVWVSVKVTVKFDCTGGQPSQAYDLQDKLLGIGEGFLFPSTMTAERYGYEFLGWRLDDGTDSNEVQYRPGSTYQDGQFTLSQSIYDNYADHGKNTIVIVACWQATPEGEYTVTFDKQGGAGGTDSIKCVRYYGITYVTPPSPPVSGWTFAGYFTTPPSQLKEGSAPQGMVNRYGYGFQSGPTSDITLYAYWIRDITLDANGGTAGSVTSVKAIYNAPLGINLTRSSGANEATSYLVDQFTESNVPANHSSWQPSMSNYEFCGYSESAYGSGHIFITSDGRSVEGTPFTYAGVNVLYAKWERLTYTVMLDPNGGTQEGTTWLTGACGDIPIFKTPSGAAIPIPVKEGYRFTGYYFEHRGSIKYAQADPLGQGYLVPVTENWVSTSGDITLQAHWVENVVATYTITWVDGDRNTLRTDTISRGAMPSAAGLSPTKASDSMYTYTWNGGWDPTPVAATGDATYTATFDRTPRTYEVTLDLVMPDAGYTGDTTLKYQAGTGCALPWINEVYSAWTFAGWYENASYAGNATDRISSTATGNKTLHAKWTRDITLHHLNGQADSTVRAVYGQAFPSAPTSSPVPSTPAGNWQFLGYCDIDPAENPTSVMMLINNKGQSNLSRFTGDSQHVRGLTDLYAYWMMGVTLNPNGGTANTFTSVNALRGASLGLCMTTAGDTNIYPNFPYGNAPYRNPGVWKPQRAGYTFTGYYGANGEMYINAEGYPVTSTKFASENSEVYAQWQKDAPQMVTIRWVDGDGNVLKTEQIEEGARPDYAGPTPTKTATAEYTYTWTGEWRAEPGIDVYAIYTALFTAVPRTYAVKLNANGGTIASGKDVTSYTYSESEQVALPSAADMTKAGHAFAGWFEDASFSGSAISSIPARSTGDKTYFAKWEAGSASYSIEHYKQNVDGAGYTLAETVPATGTVGQSVTAVARTYTGFHENTTASDRVASGTIPATGTLILKLFYDRDVHTVSFVTGTTQTIPAQDVRYEATATKPTDPARTGYTFAGWRTGSATGTAYDFATKVTGDLTLYAGWDAVRYTITWNANGGTFAGGAAMHTTEVAHGTATSAVDVPTPTRLGYGFGGWATTSGGTTQATLPQSTTEKTTYWAIWTANAVSYTVRYVDTDGAQIRTPKSLSGTVNASVTETAPAITGYTVQGASSRTITLAADASKNSITFTYKANTTAVTFDGEGTGGMLGGTVIYTFGKTLPALSTTTAPTRPGYTFAGWKTADGTLHYTSTGTVALSGAWSGTQATLALTSAWDANTYHIRYEAGEGSGSSYTKDIRYAQGAVFDTLAQSGMTAPENCAFAGWKVGNSIYQAGTRADGLTTEANVTIVATAQWVRNAYRIVWEAAGGSFGTDAQGNPVSTIVANCAKFDKIVIPDAPTRAGYVFDGWARGGVKGDPDEVATRDQTYTALWTQPLFTITFTGGAEGATYVGAYQGKLPVYANAAAAEVAAGANAAGYVFYSTQARAVQMLVRYGQADQALPVVADLYALDGASAAVTWTHAGAGASGATWQGGSQISGDAAFTALYAQGQGSTLHATFTPRMEADVPAAVSMDVQVEGGNVAVSTDRSHFASTSAGTIEVRGLTERYTADATRDGLIANARQVFGDASATSVALTMSSSPLATGRTYRLNLVDRTASAPESPIAIPPGDGQVEVYFGLQGVSVASLTRDLADLKIANIAYTIALGE